MASGVVEVTVGEGFTGIGAPGMVVSLAPGARVAGYRLEEQIGAGGMAVVFRALDERLGRPVALKILAPALAANADFRQRFIRESRVAAAVDDPHIIPVHEAGEAGAVLFIAMRYVPGGDVRSLLRREGPLAADRVVAIVSPVASALDAAHEAGLVHRDVKPGNILIDVRPGRPDHVYLSDFGLSKLALSHTGLTGSDQYLGTLDYSAPEQLAGKAVDGRADQYSLACAVVQLLTGAPPFPRASGTALILAHMSEPPPPLTVSRPDLPLAADAVLAKALAKSPQDRYATCRDFTEDLRRALGLPPYAAGHSPGPAADRPITDVAFRAPEKTLVMALQADAGSPATAASPGGPAGPAGPAGSRDATFIGAAYDEPVPLGRSVSAIAFSPDSSLLAAGDDTGRIQLWNVTGERQVAVLAGSGPGVVDSVAFSPDGTMLAAGDDNGDVILWDYRNQGMLATLPARGAGSVFAVGFSRDGVTLAAGDDNGNVVMWDARTGRKTATVTVRGAGAIFAVAFGPDGATLAAGDDNGDVTVWDYRSRRKLITFPARGAASVFAVAFSPDGTMLAAGDDYGTCLWAGATGNLAAILAGPDSGGVYALAFSPDGSTLAAGDDRGFTSLWDVRTRGRAATLTGRGSRSVTSVAFSPDGATLAAGDDNGLVYLWKWAGELPDYAAIPHRSSTLPN